jgi:hypothetical protein
MKWFNKWLLKKVQDAQNNSIEKTPIPYTEGVIVRDDSDFENEYTLRINITPARGGAVLCINRYDSRKDKNDRTVHIITENGQDVNHQIADIITVEMYKQ